MRKVFYLYIFALIAMIIFGIHTCIGITAEPNFIIPNQIILTGKILKTMPTVTSYLEYRWYEAYCEGNLTALIILVDKEYNRPVIGFIHTTIPNPENNTFILSGDYYYWLDRTTIIKLENMDIVEDYLEVYKFYRKQIKHLNDSLKCLGG